VFDGSDSHSSNSLQLLCSRAERSAISRSTDNQELITDNRAPVVFLGPAFGEAKDQLLRRASAFILPSFSEGLPMSVLEAWAYRLPVLMTEHCNLPEGFAAEAAMRIGTDGGDQRSEVGGQMSGLGGQTMSMTEGMRALMEMSDAERLLMGQRGRSLVEREFTWPQVAAQMKEVYEWVLGGGAKPRCVRE
jgi:poly(glycerol-phosphate) alpha-glucosyltransferase